MARIVFYDVEVFAFDNLVVFYELGEDGKPVFLHALWNDDKDRRRIIDGIINTSVLCGYNNHSYDDHILSLMRMGADVDEIKSRNDAIIGNSDRNYLDEPRGIRSIDCIQQIAVNTPSLKQIEGNIGISVQESDVSFDIDRELTQKEREETERYCRHDVEATIEVYKLRKSAYFDIREQLLDMMDEKDRPNHYKTNTTTIAARILLGRDRNGKWATNSKRSAITYNLPERMLRDGDLGARIPADVWDMWMKPVEHPKYINGVVQLPTGVQKAVTMGGCVYVFGFGGLHGAPSKPGHYTGVRLADVGSMYPSIIVATNALGEATEKYDSIRKERLRIKHTDKTKANALKLILNSVYGNLKNQYNPLYSPTSAASVCIYGQVALYNLCLDLTEAGYQVINANTDGVAFVNSPGCMQTRTFGDIQREWESNFSGLVLQVDEFKEWWQRDVNNYIATTPDDHIKTKGGDCNKYADDKPFDNNSLRIIQKALVDCIVQRGQRDDNFILETISGNLNEHPEWYQIILKTGGTYDGTVDQDGNKYQKVNRAFPSKNGVKLYKRRKDGGDVMFPDSPEKMVVVNSDILPGCLSWYDIDINYYYRLALKKIDAWRM